MSLRIVAIALLDTSDCLDERGLTSQILNDLSIADRLESWSSATISIEQRSYFFDESLLHHHLDSSIDPIIESLPLGWDFFREILRLSIGSRPVSRISQPRLISDRSFLDSLLDELQ